MQMLPFERRSGPSFHALLASLEAEHERELEDLRAENVRLRTACRNGSSTSPEGVREVNGRMPSELVATQTKDAGSINMQLQECLQRAKDNLKACEDENHRLRSALAGALQQKAPSDAATAQDQKYAQQPPVVVLPINNSRQLSVEAGDCGSVQVLPGQLEEALPLSSVIQIAQDAPTCTLDSTRLADGDVEQLKDKRPMLSNSRTNGTESITSSDAERLILKIPSLNGEGMRARLAPIASMGSKSMSGTTMLDANIKKFHGEEKLKQLGRFMELFDVDPRQEKQTIQIEQLETLLANKKYGIATERLQAIVAEMMRAHEGLEHSQSVSNSGWVAPENFEPSDAVEEVDLMTFVEVLVDPSLPSRVRAPFRRAVTEIRQLLLQQDIEEIIAKVTRLRKNRTIDRDQSKLERGSSVVKDRILFRMNILVSFTVLLSIVFLGVSMDHSPDSGWWVAVEALFASIFVSEFFVKLWIRGANSYFCGPHRMLHLFDLTLTFVAVGDVTFSAVMLFGGLDAAGSSVSAARITLVLRCVRLARIARLVKLFKGPFLKELANMLSGFFIGIPSLLWVMVLLAAVIYILALMLKSAVGRPYNAEPLLDRCGSGDVGSWDDPECSACTLYAEEYLYSVKSSCMVVFRCVVGDCTSKAGQSLSAHLSSCYTWKFDIIYFLGMVSVVFGLFNIITAIFVQATMDGLRFNHVQNKYAQMYESHYMRRKLEALVDRVKSIHDVEMDSDISARSYSLKDASAIVGDCHLTESMFDKVLQDTIVNSLFEDLDVEIDHRLNTFQFFDIGGDGVVSLGELIQTLMKMRGEPHKSDLVASWVLLEDLRSQFYEFQKTSLANQKEIFARQRDVIRTVMALKDEQG